MGGRHQRNPRNAGLARVNLVLLVYKLKQAGMRTDRLRRAQHQEAVGIEGVMENRHHAVLQAGAEVDQDVAAADQVQFREGWIVGDIVAGEYAGIANVLMDLEAGVRLGEEVAQAFVRNGLSDTGRVNSAASNF